MRTFYLIVALALACTRSSVNEGGGSGGSAAGGTSAAGGMSGAGGMIANGGMTGAGGAAGAIDERSCSTAADCAWGEIRADITTFKECPCLFGCPYLPQNKATLQRRQAQYKAICKPGLNSDGGPCPIDDCALPPPIECRDKLCSGPPK